jgi:hypothetical protein
MKSITAKKILFALLLVVFTYIWWGNLQLFFAPDNEENIEYDTTLAIESSSPQTVIPSTPSLEFKSYRVNPFVPTFSQPQQESVKKKATLTPPLVRLSETYQLQGVIQQGKVSQAILKAVDGRSIVIGLGDSLETWRLNQVLKQSVIFKQGVHVDTLILANQK